MGTPILILEDASADRSRFRRLLPDDESIYQFAWAWKQANGCSVFHWFESGAGWPARSASDDEKGPGVLLCNLLDRGNVLEEILRSYKLLVLDLAWTNRAEREMQSLQQATRQQGKAWANAQRSDETPLKCLLENVEGIALLEWLKSRGWKPDQPGWPIIWVTSAYVAMTSAAMRHFLNDRYGLQGDKHLFHKWMDEGPLISDLRVFLASMEDRKDSIDVRMV